jgi:predicted RNA methylase
MLHSSEETIEMLQSAGLHAGDVLYDLGCGDGRVLIAALKKGAERAIGIDTNSSALASARQNAIEAFEIDVLKCERCGGRRRIIAAIHPPDTTRKILECLGLPSRAPPVARAASESLFEEL